MAHGMPRPVRYVKVRDSLAQKRIAVAGASRDNGHHPAANLIYHRLKKTGHDVFPVNPHMQTFEGERCYPDLQSIPGEADIERLAGGRRLLPSTRYQRDPGRLFDDVRRRRRFGTRACDGCSDSLEGYPREAPPDLQAIGPSS